MQLYYRAVQGDAHDCAMALLADALAMQGRALADYTLCRTPLGKPYFAQEDAPHFSLCHTKTLVLCAISNAPIGVDAEPCDRKVSPAVCRRFLDGCPPADAIRRWTERESFGKLTGEGVASQRTPFDAELLCFHSYLIAEHLVTVCHRYTDPPTPPQEL